MPSVRENTRKAEHALKSVLKKRRKKGRKEEDEYYTPKSYLYIDPKQVAGNLDRRPETSGRARLARHILSRHN